MKPRSKKTFEQLVAGLSDKKFMQAIAEMCACERLDMAKQLCDLAEDAQSVSSKMAKYKSCPDMVAQSDRLLVVSIALTRIAERVLEK